MGRIFLESTTRALRSRSGFVQRAQHNGWHTDLGISFWLQGKFFLHWLCQAFPITAALLIWWYRMIPLCSLASIAVFSRCSHSSDSWGQKLSVEKRLKWLPEGWVCLCLLLQATSLRELRLNGGRTGVLWTLSGKEEGSDGERKEGKDEWMEVLHTCK